METPRPMFPLGTVVVPTQRIPLQLFEPRYLALIEDVLAGDRTFGTCLIERGSEVGGGDQRAGVGTLVEVVDARRVGDGRWLVEGVGRSRVRVEEWLPDDPYPRALVADHADPVPGTAERSLVDVVRAELRDRVARLLEQRGGRLPTDWLADLDPDPVHASYELVHAAPLGSFDRYRLLAADTVGVRLSLLSALVADLVDPSAGG